MDKPKFMIQTINSDGTKEEPGIYGVNELLEENVDSLSLSRRGFIIGASVVLGAGILSCKKEPDKTSRKEIFGSCGNDILSHFSRVTSVSFSPDGKLLASAGDWTVRIWEIPSGNLLRTIQPGLDKVTSLNFSPDGKFLAGSSEDKDVKIWEIPSGNLLKTLSGHTSVVTSVSFSPDNKLLASGSEDKTVIIREMPSGNLFLQLKGHTDKICSIAFSPDGKLLASGSSFLEHAVKVWEIPSGNLLKTLTGHGDGVNSLNFSPDGKLLASGSEDKTMQIWEIPSGNLSKTLTGHGDGVNSLNFSPDGKLIASGSDDKTVKIWDMQAGEFVSCLFDPCTLDSGKKVISYTRTTADGRTLTYTIPYTSALPAGALCTCNSVQGTSSSSGSSGGSYRVCTCVPIK